MAKSPKNAEHYIRLAEISKDFLAVRRWIVWKLAYSLWAALALASYTLAGRIQASGVGMMITGTVIAVGAVGLFVWIRTKLCRSDLSDMALVEYFRDMALVSMGESTVDDPPKSISYVRGTFPKPKQRTVLSRSMSQILPTVLLLICSLYMLWVPPPDGVASDCCKGKNTQTCIATSALDRHKAEIESLRSVIELDRRKAEIESLRSVMELDRRKAGIESLRSVMELDRLKVEIESLRKLVRERCNQEARHTDQNADQP